VKGEIGAIITYVIPAGDCPTKTKFVEAVNGGRSESVADFFNRCKELVKDYGLISIELKEIE
jgi:hypothetical protein